VALLFAASLLRHLSYPLLWNDEAETVAYAQRILTFGYPKVSDGRNLVYDLDAPLAVGRKEDSDAYIGSVWGQYYFATLGVWAAQGVDDLHARTARFRLPFVLAGITGLAALALALAVSFGARRAAAAWSVAGFLGLAMLSTSLALHLREARYHGLAIGLQGLLVLVYHRHAILGRGRALPCAVSTTLLLLLLYNTFPPAAFAWAAALVVDVAVAALRGPASRNARLRRLAVGWLPLLLFGLLVLPLARFYETAEMTRWYWRFNPDMAFWLRRSRVLLDFLLWREPLAAIVAVKLIAEVLHAVARAPVPGIDPRLRLSRLLALAAVFELLAATGIPFAFDRYAMPALPLLAASLILDVGLALDLARSLTPAPRLAARLALAGALVFSFALILPAKREELQGRLAELREPVLGPLDFVIPRLRSLRDDPSSLVIATNYETSSYVVYLGSRTLVGYTGANRAADLAASPDVIISRKNTRRYRAELATYWNRERFVRETFPVVDLPYNNIPQLTPLGVIKVLHQYRTPRPTRDEDRLEIWVRADLEPMSAPGSR
jgi:hypothetical protein